MVGKGIEQSDNIERGAEEDNEPNNTFDGAALGRRPDQTILPTDKDLLTPVTITEKNDAAPDKELPKQVQNSIKDIVDGVNKDPGRIDVACNRNIRNLVRVEKEIDLNPQSQETYDREQVRDAMTKSLSNAESVGGQSLLGSLIERTNSELWLNGDGVQLRQGSGDADENVIELFDSARNKVIHTIRFPRGDKKSDKAAHTRRS